MCPSILGVDEHVPLLYAAERSLEEGLAIHRLAHDQLGAASRETAIVVGPDERPIEARRRHFQGVRARHHVLHVEDRAHVAADVGAVVDADAVLGRCAWTRPVNLHPQHHAACLATELDIENLQTERPGHAAGDGTHLADNVRCRHLFALKQKKWAYAHFGPTPRVRIKNYSTGRAIKS